MVYRIEKTTRTVIYLKKAILIRSGSTKNYPIRNIKCTGKEEKINSLREGMHVRLEGMLVLPELPRNPGQFNRRIYESGKKIDFYLENPTVLEVKEQRSGVREVVEIWKTEMMNRCEKIYPNCPGISKNFIRQRESAMCLSSPVCISAFLPWRSPGFSDGWVFPCRFG